MHIMSFSIRFAGYRILVDLCCFVDCDFIVTANPHAPVLITGTMGLPNLVVENVPVAYPGQLPLSVDPHKTFIVASVCLEQR